MRHSFSVGGTGIGRALFGAFVALASAACTSEPKQAITADWLDGSISFVDYDTLIAGESTGRERLDVSGLLPGPLEIEVTPDRRTAVATVSTGFFRIPVATALVDSSPMPPSPTGKVLFVDLTTRTYAGELDTGEDPMGIAITPDSSRAFIPHFTSGNMAIVDLRQRTLIKKFDIGIAAEEIAFDSTGTVGIFSFGAFGQVRTFAVSDPEATMSAPVDLKGDSAGVAFFPGTKIAYVVQAMNPLLQVTGGYSLIDVTNPQAPVVLQDERPNDQIGYAVAAVPERNTVVTSGSLSGGKLVLREYRLAGTDVELVRTIPLMDGLFFGPFAMKADGKGHVLSALPRERSIIVTDLASETSTKIAWSTKAGPTDIDVF